MQKECLGIEQKNNTNNRASKEANLITQDFTLTFLSCLELNLVH